VVLLQQQASATIGTTIAVAGHNKCSGDDIISCTHDKKAHPVKDRTPFDLPLPFP
jgi:hypothetical protein